MSRKASASDNNPVPNLKDFVFEKKLGSGTYASVYKAYKTVFYFYYYF